MAKNVAKKQVLFVNMLRPRNPEVSLQIAKEADSGGTPNLDQGLYSKTEAQALWKESEEGNGRFPYMYDPVVMELGMSRGALFGVEGQESKNSRQPKEWPSKFGDWKPSFKLDKGRLCHNLDLDKEASIVEGALVTVGKDRYIVGTTGADGIPAPLCITGSKRGNFAANERVKDRLSFVDSDGKCIMVKESGDKVTQTEFNTVVMQINRTAQIVTFEDGGKIVFRANRTGTWGFLLQDGKVLTASQIRKLDGDAKVTFQPLKERWIGRAFDKSEFSTAIVKEMKTSDIWEYEDGTKSSLLDRYEAVKTKEGKKKESAAESAWKQLGTQSRQNPDSKTPYGLRYAAIGKAIGKTYSEDGKEMFFGILGGHLTHGLAKRKWDINKEQKVAEVTAPEETETKSKGKKSGKKSEASVKPTAKKSSKGKGKGKSKATETATVTETETEEVPTTETEAPAVDDQTVEDEALQMEEAEARVAEAEAMCS